MTLVTSRSSSQTSARLTNSSATQRKSPGRPSKLRSRNEALRPNVDPLVELLGSQIEKMHEYATYAEMLEDTWVSRATLAKYKARKGRYIRSDTLRGILRIFGLRLRIEK